MFYADSITKNFLTGSGLFNPVNRNSTLGGRWLANEDPTYMGFWVYLPPKNFYATNDNIDVDRLPQGLLLPGGEVGSQAYSDSAVSYLKRRNEFYRAAMIEEFQQGFVQILNKAPWMIQKVGGVSSLWKINPQNNWRAKEATLTFECLETIDLKMTYLIDLYRKAAWDAVYHRWVLPDCQRYFSMDLVVAEVRTMQRNGSVYNVGTFSRFVCDYCEIEPFADDIGYLENLSAFVENQAVVKFKVKVGKVYEVNTYGLLGALLSDSNTAFKRSNDYRESAFTQDSTQTDSTGSNVNRQIQNYFVYRGDARYRNNVNLNTLLGTATADLPTPVSNAISAAVNSIQNSLNQAVNTLKLGNVYGFSPSTVAAQLEGALNNPVGAFQGLLSNVGVNQEVAQAVASNIQLTGPEIDLVKDLIGNVKLLAAAVAGTDLENATIAEIAEISASERLSGTLGNVQLESSQINPATTQNVGLNSPQINRNNQQQVNLASPNISNQVSPLNIVLQANGGSLNGNPGKVTFVSPTVGAGISPAKTTLDAPQIVGSGDTKVPLDAPQISTSQPGKVELEAPNISNGSVKVELESAPVTGVAGGKVELEAPTINNQSDKQVILEGPEITNQPGGNVELESAPIFGNPQQKVELESAEINTQIERQVKFESPTINKDIEKSVDFETPQINKDIQKIVELEAPAINLSSDKKVELISPSTLQSNPGTVEFIEPEKSSTRLDNIGFDSPAINTNIDKNVILEDNGAILVTKINGVVDLSAPQTSLAGLENVNLEGPDIVAAKLEKVKFDETVPNTNIERNINLEDNGASIVAKDRLTVKLEGVSVLPKPLGAVDLIAPSVEKNIDIEDYKFIKPSANLYSDNLGKENLK